MNARYATNRNTADTQARWARAFHRRVAGSQAMLAAANSPTATAAWAGVTGSQPQHLGDDDGDHDGAEHRERQAAGGGPGAGDPARTADRHEERGGAQRRRHDPDQQERSQHDQARTRRWVSRTLVGRLR